MQNTSSNTKESEEGESESVLEWSCQPAACLVRTSLNQSLYTALHKFWIVLKSRYGFGCSVSHIIFHWGFRHTFVCVCDWFCLCMWMLGWRYIAKRPCSSVFLMPSYSSASAFLFVSISSRSSLHFSFLLAFFFDMLTTLTMRAGTCECILVCCEVNGFL